MKALASLSHHWSRRLAPLIVVLVLLALPLLVYVVYADTVVNWAALGRGTGASTLATAIDSPAALNDRIELASSVTGGKASSRLDLPDSHHPLQAGDTTAPTIVFTRTPQNPPPYSGDWYKSNVTLVWNVSEPESPASLQKIGCVDQNITQDQPETTYSCSATSDGGSAGPVSVTIKRDMTPPPAPQIVATVVGAGTYVPGTWATNDVFADVIWPQDNMSGIASCTSDKTITKEGANQTVTANCLDKAGNQGATRTISVSIDKTAPTGSPTVNPVSPTGYYKDNVLVTWNWGDKLGGSGIDPATCPTSTWTTGTGSTRTATATCKDYAGNVGTATKTIMVDTTRPKYEGYIDATSNGQPYNAGSWTNGPVTVRFKCTDAESGPVKDAVPETISTEGANQTLHAPAADCVDYAGNTAEVEAVFNGVYIDTTHPVIKESSRTPGANKYTWNNSDVKVTFTCEETGSTQSGLAVNNVPAATVTGEGQNLSATGSGGCVDKAGNSAAPLTVSGFNIDRTLPVITGSRTPGPNGYGWNKSDVTVSFTCSDSGPVQSGIAASNVPAVIVTGEGKDLKATSTGSCVDKADNSAAMITVGGINIDRTKPAYPAPITGVTAQAAGSSQITAKSNGVDYSVGKWTNSAVIVSFPCNDSLSGPVNPFFEKTMDVEGDNQTATAPADKCMDMADNMAENDRSFGPIRIDKTNPFITTSRSSQPNGYGWYKSDVTVSFTCSDALSGVASGITNPFYQQTLSGEGAGQQVTSQGSCKDVAGNMANPATVTEAGINIDLTKPEITATPPPGSYLVGCTTQPKFTATDNLSGVVQGDPSVQALGLTPLPNGTVVNRFIVTAQDKAGNLATPPPYDYLAYSLSDPFFLPPVEAHSTSLFNLGSVIPIKFQLRDCSGKLITTAIAKIMIVYKVPAAASTQNIKPMASTQEGDTGDQFRVVGDTYMYNWKTKGITYTGDFDVSVKIDGIILRTATIGLR